MMKNINMVSYDSFIMLIQQRWSARQWAKVTHQNRELTFSESSTAHGSFGSGQELGHPR